MGICAGQLLLSSVRALDEVSAAAELMNGVLRTIREFTASS